MIGSKYPYFKNKKQTNMIRAEIIGHLGKDAVVSNVNGKSVVNFSVAHSEKFKDANGVQKERSVWADCSWWIEKTTIVQYLKKGTLVYVDGQPNVRAYTNQNGQQGATLTLRVNSVQLLGGNGGKKQEEPQQDFLAQPNGFESNDVSF
jgi:single-strand DNA-binding protein